VPGSTDTENQGPAQRHPGEKWVRAVLQKECGVGPRQEQQLMTPPIDRLMVIQWLTTPENWTTRKMLDSGEFIAVTDFAWKLKREIDNGTFDGDEK
jgi:hypothetical protein